MLYVHYPSCLLYFYLQEHKWRSFWLKVCSMKSGFMSSIQSSSCNYIIQLCNSNNFSLVCFWMEVCLFYHILSGWQQHKVVQINVHFRDQIWLHQQGPNVGEKVVLNCQLIWTWHIYKPEKILLKFVTVKASKHILCLFVCT
jgi:hypothetical protein